jgi:predicted small metal-binding protein
MAKVLRCRDVGVDCDFECRGATVDEVLACAAKHAKEGHGLKEVDESYYKAWRKKIKDEK